MCIRYIQMHIEINFLTQLKMPIDESFNSTDISLMHYFINQVPYQRSILQE